MAALHCLRSILQRKGHAGVLRLSGVRMPWGKQAGAAAHMRGIQQRCYAASEPTAPKAALLVIGDEILAGSITDTNTPWLAKLLNSRGVDLIRVEYIPDNKATIKEALLNLKQRVGPQGFVFTSGGIGPTHDDVTYEAIAEALGAKLGLHPPTVERMRESYSKRGLELNEARLRMATLPEPSEVLFTEGVWVPLVNIQGVYILPGIPKLFQSMVSAHQARFTGVAAQSVSLYTALGEGDIASILTPLAAQHAKVAIGSYPNTKEGQPGGGTHKVKLSFTSRDTVALTAAREAVKAAFPAGTFADTQT